MALIKQGGSLYESSQEEQQKAAALPTTPAGAAAQGANEDESKMIGTQANKEATIKKIAQPGQTLQQARRERQTVQDRPQQPSMVEAKEKLNRISSAGSIESQLEARIQQKLDEATAQQAELQVSEATIEALPVSQQAQATDIINRYAKAISEGNMGGNELVAISKLLGREVSPAEMQSWFQGGAATLGSTVGQYSPATLTMGEAGIGELGDINEISADLGITPEELNNYTLEQFQQKIQEVEGQEYNRVQNLQAELASATGARREQLLRELGSEAQAGTTGIEAQFDRIQKDIEEASTIDIAGEEFTLSEILEDDGLSKFIEDAARSPEAMANLEQNAPALAEWVKSNMEALKQLGADIQESGEAFNTTQEEVRNLKTSVGSEELMEILFPGTDEFMTAEDAAAFKESIENNPIVQAMGDDDWFKTRLNSDPKLAAELKNFSKEQIGELSKASQVLTNYPNIASIIGLDGGGFLTDPSKLGEIDYFKNINDRAPALLADGAFVNAFKDGLIDKSVVNVLVNNPEEWQDVNRGIKITKELANIGDDLDGLVNYMFGGGVDDLNSTLKTLKNKAMLGDKKAEAEYKRLHSVVGESIGAEDIEALKSLNPSTTDLASGKANLKETITPMLNSFSADLNSGDFVNRVMPLINDGVIDSNEINDLSWDEQEELMANPEIAAMYKGGLEKWKRNRDWNLVESTTKEFTDEFKDMLGQTQHLQNISTGVEFVPALKELTDIKNKMKKQLDTIPADAPQTRVEMERLIKKFDNDWKSAIKKSQDHFTKQVNEASKKAAPKKPKRWTIPGEIRSWF